MTEASEKRQEVVHKAWRFLTELESSVTREYNRRTDGRSKTDLRYIIEQRDRDLKAQGGLVQVIGRMVDDAGLDGMPFFEIANRLFPELDPDKRDAVGALLEETYGDQLRRAESIGFALIDNRKNKKAPPKQGSSGLKAGGRIGSKLKELVGDESELRFTIKVLAAMGQIVATGEMRRNPKTGEDEPCWVTRDVAETMGLPLPPLLSKDDLPDELLTHEERAERKARNNPAEYDAQRESNRAAEAQAMSEIQAPIMARARTEEAKQAIRNYVEELVETLAELIEHYHLPIEISIASINQHVGVEIGKDSFVLQPKTDAGRKLIEILEHEDALSDAAERGETEATERPMTPRRLTQLP
jgi:hypothetical protein